MQRRQFLGTGTAATAALAATATIAAPAIVRANPSFTWKMTSAYGPKAAFYSTGPGSATDLIKRIDTMSGGRIKIQFFGAGELVPALEGFDAASSGVVEMNYGNAYFWTGKSFAAQYFTAVPFGLNFQGVNGWLYEGGGLQLWREAYEKFNLVPLPCGNTGVQMTGWFRKPIEKVEDFQGLKMRIPGLAGQVYKELGVDVRLLPAGEIFPALERGVIDAAEFVGPFLDRQLGLHKVTKYYHTTGWHENATVSELVINRKAWDSLPDDLKAVIENACAACNTVSQAWAEANNAAALQDLVKNQGVIAAPLPAPVITKLREVTTKVLAEKSGTDPFVKKVHDSFFAFREQYRAWASISEGVYHQTILG